MQKLEIVGDARTLIEGAGTFIELNCTVKTFDSLEIVPVKIDNKTGFVLVGKHHVSTRRGIFSPVEMTLLLGANGTITNLSEPVGPASESTRVRVLNTLRRYSIHYLRGNISSQSDVVLGLNHNGKGMDELLYVVGDN